MSQNSYNYDQYLVLKLIASIDRLLSIMIDFGELIICSYNYSDSCVIQVFELTESIVFLQKEDMATESYEEAIATLTKLLR